MADHITEDGARDVALFTKSYAADLELCRRLCASIDRHMPETTHYLAIDRVDEPLFAPLASERRKLIISEDYLPGFLQMQWSGRRFWLSLHALPLRGWVQQQLVKLAAIAALPERAVTMLDSDAVLLRPIPQQAVLRDGRTRLYIAPGEGRMPSHLRWHRVAARALGLPDTDYFGADYIITAVTWRPEVVRALLARIAETAGTTWLRALSRRLHLSECILYGVFCNHVAGPHQALIFEDRVNLCHANWGFDMSDEAGRRAMVEALQPHHAAVVIQSNLGLDLETHDAMIAALEEQVRRQAAAA